MADEELLNSSDVEMDTPAVDLFSKLGAASIQAMKDNAAELRIASKAFSKGLMFTKGGKKAQYKNSLWYNRLQAFREHVLRISTQTPPNGEQIERFLFSIVGLVKPKSHLVPSYSWLTDGFDCLRESLLFYYQNFELSPHEMQRITTTIHRLHQEGRITKEPSRTKRWVGVFIVRKLVVAMFEDGLQNGVLNWEVTLSKVTSIVLMAALSCRAGDFLRDPLNEQPLPYLVYEDIVLKLSGGNQLEDVVGKFLIRNEKGAEDDPSNNRIVIIKSVKTATDNPLCPIKLILILALRSGNVNGTSIDDVLKKAELRHDKTIVWVNPIQPVIRTIARGCSFLLAQAANKTQIARTVSEAGLIAGVLSEIIPHDIRRGAARDTANLKDRISGVATEAVAATLGHSNGTYHTGVTGKYVGHISADVWGQRIAENFEDPFGLEIANTRFEPRKRRKTSTEVSDLCRSKGLDQSDPKARLKAFRLHRAESIKVWMQNAESEEPSEPESGSDEATYHAGRDSESNDDHDEPYEDPEEDPELEESQDGLSDEETDLVHFLANTEDTDVPEGVETALFDQLQGPAMLYDNQIIFGMPIEFVRSFSTINITRNQRIIPGRIREEDNTLEHYRGNSRDEPTFFLFSCTNVTFGCQYQHAIKLNVSYHEKTCVAEAIKPLVMEFRCSREGCQSGFDTLQKLERHIKERHDWEAQGCPKPDCNSTVTFQTESQLKDHLSKFHSSFTPTRCLVPGCKAKTRFQISKTYLAHLTKQHHLDGSDRDQYRPPPSSE